MCQYIHHVKTGFYPQSKTEQGDVAVKLGVLHRFQCHPSCYVMLQDVPSCTNSAHWSTHKILSQVRFFHWPVRRRWPGWTAAILQRSSSLKVLCVQCSPSFDNVSLIYFDDVLKQDLLNIFNCDLSEMQWLQTSLPLKDSGLGSVAALATSIFLASAVNAASLQELALTYVGWRFINVI